MKSFLENCAADILRKFGNKNTVCVVFPNKRTLLHFRKAYAHLIGEVTISGYFYPIDKVLSQFISINTADELTLLFKLYEAFRTVFCAPAMLNTNLAKDFNTFFDTGRKILSDFNEIDNYLVDIHQLCRNFADLNEIDALYATYEPEIVDIIKKFWANFSQERLSKEKKRYMELWLHLPNVYDLFRKNLIDAKISYSGMKNRMICDIINKNGLTSKFDTYIFVGFNVLNKCEQKIFRHLKDSHRAKFYWDADEYYISDKTQEAGLFMRSLLSEFPDELNSRPQANIINSPKDVEYIGVPLEVSQAKCTHDIIEDLAKQPDYNEDKTAVVLGDEHLLFPVLNSMPACVQKVNVTMGYPFVETPVYSFLLNCLQLRKNFRRTSNGGNYYFSDVLAILNHPLVVSLPDFHSRLITSKINDERMVRVEASMLGSYSNILNVIFCNYENETCPSDILTNFLTLLSELYFVKNPSPSETPKLENEFIFEAYKAIKALYNNFETLTGYDINSELVVNILKQHLISIKVPFESDDDHGIQITGMMETRNLDFDNVIMLGMNEGVFPKRSENNSFITEAMRLAFDMPIVKYKDAVFGYFFYRLFQRAKTVRILYNNVFTSNLSGEPSRFATQILKEASSEEYKDSKLNITLRQFVRDIKPSAWRSINVENNGDTLERLKPYYTLGTESRALSPSALNTFIDCPLKFYFKYVAKLKPIEQLDEEASAADFGSILHGAIEKLYNDIKDANRIITSTAIENIQPQCEHYALQSYNEVFKVSKKSKEDLSGFESIFFDVLMQYLQRILNYDKTIAPFELIGAEKGAYCTINVPCGNTILHVNIGGKLDRIDRIANTNKIRIVDYKTGNMAGKMKFASVADVFDNTKKEKRPSQAFQMLMYSHIYTQRHQGEHPIPIIYAVRGDIKPRESMFAIGADKQTRYVDDTNITQLTDEFAIKLTELLTTLFDPTQTFSAHRTSRCSTCDYMSICGNK